MTWLALNSQLMGGILCHGSLEKWLDFTESRLVKCMKKND